MITFIKSLRSLKAIVSDNKKGVTLVELMIVAGLLGVVLTLGYNIYQFSEKTFKSGEIKANMQQVVWIGTDFIENEVRYATELEILTGPPSSITANDKYSYIYIKNGSLVRANRNGEAIIVNGNSLAIGLSLLFRDESQSSKRNILYYRMTSSKDNNYNIESRVLVSNLASDISNTLPGADGYAIKYLHAAGEKFIKEFKFINGTGGEYLATIEETTKKISLIIPNNESLSFSPKITYFGSEIKSKVGEAGTSVSENIVSGNPSFGNVRDFSKTVIYTIIAEDGSSVDYTVTVTQSVLPEAYVWITLENNDIVAWDTSTLVGNYTYFANGGNAENAESPSSTAWYTCLTNADGSVNPATAVKISGSDNKKKFVPTGLAGQYVAFGVIPKSSTGVEGKLTFSIPYLIIKDNSNNFMRRIVNDISYYSRAYKYDNTQKKLIKLTKQEIEALNPPLPYDYVPEVQLRTDSNILSTLDADTKDIFLKMQLAQGSIGGSLFTKELKVPLDVSDIDSYTIVVDAQVVSGSGWGFLLSGNCNPNNYNMDVGYMFQFDPGANGFLVRQVGNPTEGAHSVTDPPLGGRFISGDEGVDPGAHPLYTPVHIKNSNFTWGNSSSQDSADWKKRYKTAITVQVQQDKSLIFRVRVYDANDPSKVSNDMWFGNFGTINLNGTRFDGLSMNPYTSSKGTSSAGKSIGLRTWERGGGSANTIFYDLAVEEGFSMNISSVELISPKILKVKFDNPLRSSGINVNNMSFQASQSGKTYTVNNAAVGSSDNKTLFVELSSALTSTELSNTDNVGSFKITEKGSVKQLFAGDVRIKSGTSYLTKLSLNSKISGLPFGTSPASPSSNTYEKAFDGDTSTLFRYSDDDDGYAGIDLGTGNSNRVTYIRYYPRDGYESRMAGGKFQGSNTSPSSGYTDIYTIPSTPTAGWNYAEISNTNSYRYLRYLGPNDSYCNVAEIEFYSDKSVPRIVNNDDSGIRYNGTWTFDSGRGYGDYGDDVHYTNTNGRYFEYTFTGTGVEYISEKNSVLGDVDIYVDGVFDKTINCSNSNRLTQQVLYSKTGLTPGPHTIKVVKKSGNYALVDALKIYD